MLLQRLIKHFHLTQLEIQRETGVDQSRLSRYFRGRVPRALDDVFKLQELERKMEDQERKAAKKASKEKEAAPS